MQALIDYAASRGTQRLVGYVLRENRAMLGLMKELGFQSQADAQSPADVVQVSRETRPPSAQG
jgi:acetyltransferase